MKKITTIFCIILFIFALSTTAMAADGCTTIPSGQLYDSMGNVITPGFNQYGYNYQAKITNQGIEEYCQQRNDIPEGQNGHWDYADCIAYFERAPFNLVMKWNDAWLSNQDCDSDGKLDRHYGYSSYQGSGAWCTNHQSGTVIDENGKKCKWIYFVKIVAAPTDAVVQDVGGVDYWYTLDGVEIGPVIWGSFAIIQQIENDPCYYDPPAHGIQYLSPDHAGLGNW